MWFVKFFLVKSHRDAARVFGVLVVMSVLASLLFGEIIARAIGQTTDWKYYVFATGMPLLMTPIVAVPLIGMNFHLNAMRAELNQLARTDALTGLMNRRALFDQVSRICAMAPRPAVAVLVIDLDHFKQINDTYGHDAGDAVLKQVAATASAAVMAAPSNHKVIGRIGGEEFVAILTGLSDRQAEGLADDLCSRVREGVCRHNGHDLRVTASIGVASGAGETAVETLVKAADTAVYEAKRRGRDRWCVAAPAMAAANHGESQHLRGHPRAA